MSEQPCIFCEIIGGRAQASFVYRDEVCSAFLDIQPVNSGHALVIPNRHAAYLADLEPEDGAQLFRVGQKVARALQTAGLRCEGVNMFLADGQAAMQEVFHVHLHVFPRFKGDGFGLKFPPSYSQKPDRSTLEDVARIIRGAI